MLTKLANGSAVDLSKAIIIKAAEGSEKFPEIKPRVIIEWFHESPSGHHGSSYVSQIVDCDTFEAARKERDRLIEIANNSPKQYVRIKDRYYRSSDVREVTTCGWDGSNWFIVAHVRNAANDGTHSIAINCESEEQGNALAREIMEQVAGVAE